METGITLPLSDDLKDFCVRFIACFLILWTPFFFFSDFRGHPIPATALIYSAILFALAALVFTLIMGQGKNVRRIAIFTLITSLFLDLQAPWFDGTMAYVGAAVIAGVFWLIREHLALILASAFATILFASALTTPAEQYIDHTVVINHGTDDTSTAQGIIIHLILDGFAGLPGIPEDVAGGRELKLEIADFFHSYGFILHTGAISEYLSSKVSISGILNFEASDTPEKNFHGKRPFVVKNNAYFEQLHRRNYKISVYQSTYLDYCTEAPVSLASCFTYRYDGTDWLRSAALSDFQKMSVLFGMYLNRSGQFEAVWKSYVKLRNYTQKIGISLPAVMVWDGAVAPITAMPAFDHFRMSVIEAQQGTAHFTHLLLPHSPYVYDADCNLKDHPFDWLGSHPLYEKDNTRSGRDLRYRQYFAQIRCTLRELRLLFDGLKEEGKWADAEIILHGDHGSRIYETAPRKKNRERLTAQDMADGFNTLFAVKSPHAQAIASDRAVPVSQLLANIAGAGDQSIGKEQTLTVYLEGQNDEPWTAIPWQEIP